MTTEAIATIGVSIVGMIMSGIGTIALGVLRELRNDVKDMGKAIQSIDRQLSVIETKHEALEQRVESINAHQR